MLLPYVALDIGECCRFFILSLASLSPFHRAPDIPGLVSQSLRHLPRVGLRRGPALPGQVRPGHRQRAKRRVQPERHRGECKDIPMYGRATSAHRVFEVNGARLQPHSHWGGGEREHLAQLCSARLTIFIQQECSASEAASSSSSSSWDASISTRWGGEESH